ncbi:MULTISPECIES: hypothetical protein [unclassified Streptomyces]|uniref:hypothetical protein n=1 Tax=unclassified Streptomyces TaxID=2593676 RepID=UPI000DC79556|nr:MULTISPECIES: hypothetical protein [unclassified Streptomyces]AWZ04877.1 hypothetical protein DRB89_09695 [Streptomyces sp. ICC4]AWZ12012.1 hypothetical protein DRB96_06440 [Streptomyces sp. ICC1]
MTPRLRIGSDEVWVALTAPERAGDGWRVTADWGGELTADFEAYVEAEEVTAFAERLLARLRAAEPEAFWDEVSESRANPLRLAAIPAGDGDLAFVARLTPLGHDTTNHLDMEIGPVPFDGLRADLEAFRRDLV